MLGDGLSRVALVVLGYLYPAYKTFKVVQLPATRSNDTLLRHWCEFWALMAVFTAAQPLADTFCWWLPLYYEAKLALAVYLWANELSGTRHVWDRYFHPAVSRYEPVVDRRLAESKAVARDWLHSNTMRLLALAQQKALAWLAQVQAQAAGRVAGGPADAAAEAAAPRRQRSSRHRGSRSRAPPVVEEVFSEEEEELSEEENAVAANRGTRGRRAAGKAAAAAGAAPEEPVARFSSFSLASFYSARSSDLQAADVSAGLKGFPVLFAGSDARSPGSSKDD